MDTYNIDVYHQPYIVKLTKVCFNQNLVKRQKFLKFGIIFAFIRNQYNNLNMNIFKMETEQVNQKLNR